MDIVFQEDSVKAAMRGYRMAMLALRNLPNGCAPSVAELATRIGADKLELIRWMRQDVEFARLIESKVAT